MFLGISLIYFLSVLIVPIDSSLREVDLINRLPTPEPRLIVHILKEKINQRSESIEKIRHEFKYNLNREQDSFINLTIHSLEMLNNATHDLSIIFTNCDSNDNHELRNLIKQYEKIINITRHELTFTGFGKHDYETADSLLEEINHKSPEWIKSQALSLIDNYLEDLELIPINNQLNCSNSNLSKVVKFIEEQLESLSEKITNITINEEDESSKSINSLNLSLENLKFLIEMISCKSN